MPTFAFTQNLTNDHLTLTFIYTETHANTHTSKRVSEKDNEERGGMGRGSEGRGGGRETDEMGGKKGGWDGLG